MKTPLRIALAEAIALGHAKSGRWRLGTVHEVRVQMLNPGKGKIAFSFMVTRRRDVRVAA